MILESTIGKHQQIILENWYSKLKVFSLSLMKDILEFCEKTIAETTSKISKLETYLKLNRNQEQFKDSKREIQTNKTAAKQIL